MTGSLKLTLPAELSFLSDARRLMDEVAAGAGLSPERTFDLKVAVSEACANAIEHAGEGVQIVASLLCDRVVVDVTNRGTFLPASGGDGGRRRVRGTFTPIHAAIRWYS